MFHILFYGKTMFSAYCYECNGTKRFIKKQEASSFLADFYNALKQSPLKIHHNFIKSDRFLQLLWFRKLSKI